MIRLLWVGRERLDPEEHLASLEGRRPAPEPITFGQATPEALGRHLAEVILFDTRDSPDEAVAIMRKLRGEISQPMLAVVGAGSVASLDLSYADDFISDQATPDELEARLSRLVSDPAPESDGLIRRGEITINRERFEVKVGGDALDLTFKEFELIAYLAARPGKVCSRHTLLSEVWGYDFFGGTRTVDVHVRRLRAKLGSQAHMIETVRNVGYRFSG